INANPICLMLLTQLICCPFALAFDKAGKRRLAKIAMMAMTTNNSIKVNARRTARTKLDGGSKDLPNAGHTIPTVTGELGLERKTEVLMLLAFIEETIIASASSVSSSFRLQRLHFRVFPALKKQLLFFFFGLGLELCI